MFSLSLFALLSWRSRLTLTRIQQGHLTVAQSTTSRRYGDFFLRHGLKFSDVYENLRAKPLPLPKAKEAPSSANNGVPAAVQTGGKSLAAGATQSSGGKAAWGTAK